MNPTRKALPFLGLALAASAQAQVVYGTDEAGDQENFFLNRASGVNTGPLWTGQEIYGLADDDVNPVLYISEEGQVAGWALGSGAAPNVVVAPIDPSNANSIRSEAMAFIGGTLYVVEEFGAAGEEGIYSVDFVTGDATPVLIYTDPAVDIGGLDVDPTTGLFYGSSDAAAARGIYEIDLGMGTETNIAPYPAGLTDIDGLAVNPAGEVLLIQDEPVPIDVFDLGGMAYSGQLPNAVAGARVFSGGTWAENATPPSIGTPYCGPAAANSTGESARLRAQGSTAVADNDVLFEGDRMPANSFAAILASQTQSVAFPASSEGTLCLGGDIGRGVGGMILNSGATGAVSVAADLAAIPQPMGPVAAVAGDTWHFQCWFRDSVGGASTSNFSNGLSITFD